MQFGLVANGLAKAAWARYERQLSRHPVATQTATSALLWGCGDVLGQRIEGRKAIDPVRCAWTAGFGAAFMGPVGHFWYLGLDIVCTKMFIPGTALFTAAKVTLDSLVLGPAYVLAFYGWGAAFIDKTGFEGFRVKVEKDFLPTFAAEMMVWPAFQTFNFTRIPVKHQLLSVNLMSLLDACFLSWARNQEDWVSTAMAALHLRSVVVAEEAARGAPAQAASDDRLHRVHEQAAGDQAALPPPRRG
ncbi:hypothetical protein FOA52_007857 [Chlamydomonas sp. UWO 241]|nr:hypothetical protein FOA52_007857 [Chlamydomonas sp. UWO 241]